MNFDALFDFLKKNNVDDKTAIRFLLEVSKSENLLSMFQKVKDKAQTIDIKLMWEVLRSIKPDGEKSHEEIMKQLNDLIFKVSRIKEFCDLN